MKAFFGILFWLGIFTSIISACNSNWNLAFLCAIGILMILIIWISDVLGQYLISISEDLKKLINKLED